MQKSGEPMVSVVVPTYNRADLLERCLGSVLRQTWTDLELILVDDASTDDTATLAAGITDPRLVYRRHGENRGGGAARNTGLAMARGGYVAFLDSDDEWRPEKLERQLASFAGAAPDVGLVYCGFLKQGAPAPRARPLYRGDVSREILVSNFIGTASTPLIRRPRLEEVGGLDPRLPSCQDWDLWIRLSLVCAFEAVPDSLVIYHRQENSLSGDRQGVVAGHRRIARKHRRRIQALPGPTRALHHLNLGANFYRAGAWTDAAGQLMRAFLSHPASFAARARGLMRRRWRKWMEPS